MKFSEYNILIDDVLSLIDATSFEGKKFTDIFSPNLTLDELYSQIKENDKDILSKDNQLKLLKFLEPIIHHNSPKSYKFIKKSITYNFYNRNILLKGVPGTGKSHTLDKIIDTKLNIKKGTDGYKNNILKINIHSASSNADLMQGIAISTEGNQVAYKEKQGLVFELIRKACFAPYQPFVLVLEEIQENSLNELIGDLIYLIEPNKRAKIQNITEDKFKKDKYEYQELIDLYEKELKELHYVEIPNLVSIGDKNRRLIMPDNLYIFCTSNYRDDKKVIEDNLLRRFDVIEVYPKTQKDLGKKKASQEYIFKSEKASDFLENLNNAILKTFSKIEIHPDRFLIGHANWLNIDDEESDDSKKEFYKALLKVIVEFKEIKELDFRNGIGKIFDNEDFKKYLTEKKEGKDDWVKDAFRSSEIKKDGYKSLVHSLQKIIYPDFS